MRKATFTWPITLTGEKILCYFEACIGPSLEVTRRTKSTAISYLSIFRHLHNKNMKKNVLTCEKAGNLFQVETIHFICGKTLHLPGRNN